MPSASRDGPELTLEAAHSYAHGVRSQQASPSLLVAATGDSGTPAASGGGTSEKIAATLITKDNINPFFITMQQGAKEAGSKNGVDITLAAGAKDGDEEGQVKAIEAAVARGDQGILITPKKVDGVDSISVAEGDKLCWGSNK